MDKVFINFTYDSFELKTNETEILDNIKSAFRCNEYTEHDEFHTIEIQATNQGILIFLDGCESVCVMNNEQAVFHVANIFGNHFCGAIGDNICLMHAASVIIDDKAVSLIGTSGKGKTTLSLLLSGYGCYIGDEYAYIDVEKGTIWHERHPVQIKEHNKMMLEKFRDKRLVAGENEVMGKVRYIPLEYVNYMQVCETDALKIQYIVLPRYDQNQSETLLRKTKGTDIPEAILTSVMGERKPAQTLKAFLHSAALNRIVFLDLLFSDGEDAARKLYEYMKEGDGTI